MRYFALCLLLAVVWSMPPVCAQSTPAWTTRVFSSPVGQLTFSPDSTKIVVVSAGKDSLAVVDATTGTVMWRQGCRVKKYLTRVTLSPDGQLIAILEDDGFITRQVVYVLNVTTGELVNETAPLENIAQDPLFDSMVFAPDSKGLYLAQRKNNPLGNWDGAPFVIGLVRLWDFFQNSYIDTIQLQPSDYRQLGYRNAVTGISMAYHPDRPDILLLLLSYWWDDREVQDPPTIINTSTNAHELLAYNVRERKTINRYKINKYRTERGDGVLNPTQYTIDGQFIAYTRRSFGQVEYSKPGGYTYKDLPVHHSYGVLDLDSKISWQHADTAGYGLCFLTGNTYLLLNDMRIWDYSRDAIVFQLPLPNRAASTCLPLPNANYLLFAGADDITAGIYNVAERRWEETYGSTRATIAALSPTFKSFATGSPTGTVSLWQTKDWSSFPDPSVRAEFQIAATSGTTVAVYQAVTFANTSYPLATNAQFFWDFGDGSALTNEFQPVHVFTEPGIYPVQLIVDNADEDKDTVVKVVTVIEIPATGIQPEPVSVIAELPLVVPNPAGADGCRIKFTLSRPSTVRIAIANILGEEVAEPVPAIALQAGQHSFEWRTCRNGYVPAIGVYYALVQTERESFVVPIHLLR